MGNFLSRDNAHRDDAGRNDNDTLVASLAAAASEGARKAIIDEVLRKAQQGAGAGQERGFIAGLLTLDCAQQVAAVGAEEAFNTKAKGPDLANHSISGLEKVKVAAGYGAKEGLRAIAAVSPPNIEEGHVLNEVSMEVAAAAAAAGASIACLVSAQTNLTPRASKYTALLGPMFGGSLPTSAAAYHLLSASSDIVILCGFGGITLGVFVIAYGLAAGSLDSPPRSVRFARFATLAAFVIVLTLFSCALCTLFHSLPYKITCGATCGLLIVFLVLVWLVRGW